MSETMKEVTRYQCQYCKKDFKTPDRHYCKMNPALKNCFTCKHLKGWYKNYDGVDGIIYDPNSPDCAAEEPNWGDWDIETIKLVDYDMQCKFWEEGKYDWSEEEVKEDELP